MAGRAERRALNSDAEPAWRALHRDWWEQQRQPQPGDIAAAWDALYEILPAGWMTTRPTFERSNGQWNASAIAGTRIHGAKVVSAQGPTEPAAIVELARCLSEVAEGRVPG